MSGEPNPSFSGNAGGMQPPGEYCYPPGVAGSTEENPVCVYIPYEYVPGHPPAAQNPGLLEDK